MHRRNGHTYRILDGERFTLAFCGDYVCDGSHRRPVIDVIDRRKPNTSRVGYGPKRIATIPLPHVRFHRCHRFRRIGGLRWYRIYSRAIRRLAGAYPYR